MASDKPSRRQRREAVTGDSNPKFPRKTTASSQGRAPSRSNSRGPPSLTENEKDARQKANLLKLKKTQDKYEQLLADKQSEVSDLKKQLKSINHEKNKEASQAKKIFDIEKEKLNDQLKDAQIKYETEVELNKNNITPDELKNIEDGIHANHIATANEKQKEFDKLAAVIDRKNAVIEQLKNNIEDIEVELLANEASKLSIIEGFKRWEDDEKIVETMDFGNEAQVGYQEDTQRSSEYNYQSLEPKNIQIELSSIQANDMLTPTEMTTISSGQGITYQRPLKNLFQMSIETEAILGPDVDVELIDLEKAKISKMVQSGRQQEQVLVSETFVVPGIEISIDSPRRKSLKRPFMTLEVLDSTQICIEDRENMQIPPLIGLAPIPPIEKRSKKSVQEIQTQTDLTTPEIIVNRSSISSFTQTEGHLENNLFRTASPIKMNMVLSPVLLNEHISPKSPKSPRQVNSITPTPVFDLSTPIGSNRRSSISSDYGFSRPYSLSIIDEGEEPNPLENTAIQTDLNMEDIKNIEEDYKRKILQKTEEMVEIKKKLNDSEIKVQMAESYLDIFKKKLAVRPMVDKFESHESKLTLEVSCQTDRNFQPKIIEKVETKIVEVEKLKYVYLKPVEPRIQPENIIHSEDSLDGDYNDSIDWSKDTPNPNLKPIPEESDTDIAYENEHYLSMIGSLRQQNIDNKLDYLEDVLTLREFSQTTIKHVYKKAKKSKISLEITKRKLLAAKHASDLREKEILDWQRESARFREGDKNKRGGLGSRQNGSRNQSDDTRTRTKIKTRNLRTNTSNQQKNQITTRYKTSDNSPYRNHAYEQTLKNRAMNQRVSNMPLMNQATIRRINHVRNLEPNPYTQMSPWAKSTTRQGGDVPHHMVHSNGRSTAGTGYYIPGLKPTVTSRNKVLAIKNIEQLHNQAKSEVQEADLIQNKLLKYVQEQEDSDIAPNTASSNEHFNPFTKFGNRSSISSNYMHPSSNSYDTNNSRHDTSTATHTSSQKLKDPKYQQMEVYHQMKLDKINELQGQMNEMQIDGRSRQPLQPLHSSIESNRSTNIKSGYIRPDGADPFKKKAERTPHTNNFNRISFNTGSMIGSSRENSAKNGNSRWESSTKMNRMGTGLSYVPKPKPIKSSGYGKKQPFKNYQNRKYNHSGLVDENAIKFLKRSTHSSYGFDEEGNYRGDVLTSDSEAGRYVRPSIDYVARNRNLVKRGLVDDRRSQPAKEFSFR